MKNGYKWIATKGERHQVTVGFGFDTRKEAEFFASQQNRRHKSGYFVARVEQVKNPKFL